MLRYFCSHEVVLILFGFLENLVNAILDIIGIEPQNTKDARKWLSRGWASCQVTVLIVIMILLCSFTQFGSVADYFLEFEK